MPYYIEAMFTDCRNRNSSIVTSAVFPHRDSVKKRTDDDRLKIGKMQEYDTTTLIEQDGHFETKNKV